MRWAAALAAVAAAFVVVILARAGDDVDRLCRQDYPEIGGYTW